MGKLLDDSEIELFDMVASEVNELAGDEVNYHSVNKEKSEIDPIYGEYKKRHIDGPWRLPAKFSWPQQTPVSGEAGFTVEFDGQATISRVHFEEKNAPYPVEGDVIEAWRTPYHDADSMGKGLYFDIIKVDNDGHINDSPTFVQFKLTLKRRPQYAPERRLT